jgi:hypothetical protein
MKPQDCSTRTTWRPPAAWYQRLVWLDELLGAAHGPVIRRRRASQVPYSLGLQPEVTPVDNAANDDDSAADVDNDPVYRIHDGNRDPRHRSDA